MSIIFKLWMVEDRGRTGEEYGKWRGGGVGSLITALHWISVSDFIERKGSSVKKHLKMYVSLKFPMKIHLPPGVVLYWGSLLHIDSSLSLQHYAPGRDALASLLPWVVLLISLPPRTLFLSFFCIPLVSALSYKWVRKPVNTWILWLF